MDGRWNHKFIGLNELEGFVCFVLLVYEFILADTISHLESLVSLPGSMFSSLVSFISGVNSNNLSYDEFGNLNMIPFKIHIKLLGIGGCKVYFSFLTCVVWEITIVNTLVTSAYYLWVHPSGTWLDENKIVFLWLFSPGCSERSFLRLIASASAQFTEESRT